MKPSSADIARAIDFAVRATHRQFDDGKGGAPCLDDCRFSLYMALMGKLGHGQMRLAEIKTVDPSGQKPVVHLDDNVVLLLGEDMFDEWGLVSPEELFRRAEAFSQLPITPNTKLVVGAPSAGNLVSHVKPHLVVAYGEFLSVVFNGLELQQATPQVDASSARPRL